MNLISYYSSTDKIHSSVNKCSIESAEYPLTVNCAGNFKTSFPVTTDNQRNDYYLLYMISGSMEVLLGETTVNIKSGDVVIFPPHERYRYYFSGGDSLDYMWVHFTGSYAGRFLEECGLSPLPFCASTANDQKIVRRFKKLFDCYESGDELQKYELSAHLEQIIIAVSKEINATREHRSLERSLRYIHAEYMNKISIPQLAAMENLSNSRYITLFNKQMGISPTSYIIKLRMDAARELLQTTDLSVKQVGILVGYTDAHFFSKLFKKYVGISPKSYSENN